MDPARPPLRRRARPVGLALLLACGLAPAPMRAQALSQEAAPPARSRPDSARPPALGCTSLANLRMLLRDTKGDPSAALAKAQDPRSDLGCGPVDPGTVTELAEHLVLDGQAYDCLSLRDHGMCHWTLAGALVPVQAAPRKTRGPEKPPSGVEKPRR
ncbi:hypothetical protein MMB17_17090 [Methylobacterium organophilum]|nr:hypothetical protein [Methylobacterium organophilum]UMY16409.1 hypothetical protein MMB17_17090 [Methylobacterium organophilum]